VNVALFKDAKTQVANFPELKRKVTAELISVLKAANIDFLDFGCGVGEELQYFKSFSPIGIDVCKEKLLVAKKYGTVVLASGEFLPFKTGCFDIILEDNVLHHLNNANSGIVEISRCLKSGGFFFFNEVVEDNPVVSLGRTIYPYYDMMPVTSRFHKNELDDWLASNDFTLIMYGRAVFILWVWEAIAHRVKPLNKITLVASFEVWLEKHLSTLAAHYFGLAQLYKRVEIH
jgi:SAM-dependent methyltransferase